MENVVKVAFRELRVVSLKISCLTIMLPIKLVFLLQHSLLTTVSFGKFEFIFGTTKRGHLNHQMRGGGGTWRSIVDIFGPKNAVFWPEINFLWTASKKLLPS